MRKILTKSLLVLILLLAMILRFSGVKPGYPPYHSDEGISYSAAVSMIKNDNHDPLRFDYPAVVPLTNYHAYKYFFIPVSWTKYYISNIQKFIDGLIEFPLSELDKKRVFQAEILGTRERNALFWGRYTTAFLGVWAVYLTYLIGKKLFNNYAGLFASLLLAVNYRHVLNSHLGLPDIYNSFFLLVSIFFSIQLWEKNTSARYVTASIFAGLSFATKYQFFAFFPLFIVHLYHSFGQETWNERLRSLIKKEAFAVPFIILLVFLLVNPYHFIKVEETIDWMIFVAGKYRTGKNSFDFFPYSYLYHIGIGKITSVLVLLGILVALGKKFKESLLPISSILAFLCITTIATGGGFYTRNFVTIIPLLLLFTGYLFSYLWQISMRSHMRLPQYIRVIIVVAIVIIAFRENYVRSAVLAREYREDWNYEVIADWITDNIPEGNKVAAHSSVILPKTIERIPFEQRIAFSIDEWRELDTDFAVMNLDWATNDFYWWMTKDTRDSLKYWNKPIDEMKLQYPGMIIEEIEDNTIYSIAKSAFVPESNFLVTKIPKIEVLSREEKSEYDKEVKLEGASWLSDPIPVEGWDGFELSSEIKTEKFTNIKREGFLFVEFYEGKRQAEERKERIGVRVSQRNDIFDEWNSVQLVGEVPAAAKYMIVGADKYQKLQADVYIKNLVVYKTKVEVDTGGWEIDPIRLDDNLVFPNSHGNL